MKKRIVGLALFALCISLFAMLVILSCWAKAENSHGQPSRFETTLALDLHKDNTSMVEPCALAPGSGGGRGPSLTVELAYVGQTV